MLVTPEQYKVWNIQADIGYKQKYKEAILWLLCTVITLFVYGGKISAVDNNIAATYYNGQKIIKTMFIKHDERKV